MRVVLLLLVAANLLAFAWGQGWLGAIVGDARQPERIGRQVGPDRIQVLGGSNATPAPRPAASADVNASSTERGPTTDASRAAPASGPAASARDRLRPAADRPAEPPRATFERRAAGNAGASDAPPIARLGDRDRSAAESPGGVPAANGSGGDGAGAPTANTPGASSGMPTTTGAPPFNDASVATRARPAEDERSDTATGPAPAGPRSFAAVPPGPTPSPAADAGAAAPMADAARAAATGADATPASPAANPPLSLSANPSAIPSGASAGSTASSSAGAPPRDGAAAAPIGAIAGTEAGLWPSLIGAARPAPDVCFDLAGLDQVKAESARVELRQLGAASIEQTAIENRSGYVVYIEPSPTAEQAYERVAQLRDRGVRDLYLIPEGSYRLAISLGVFRTMDSVDVLLARLRDRGVDDAQVGFVNPTATRLTLRVRGPGDGLDEAQVQAIATARGARLSRCP